MLSTVVYVIAALVMGALLGAFIAGRVWSYLVRASQRQFKEMAQAFDELKATADKLLGQRNEERERNGVLSITVQHLEAKCREQQRTIDAQAEARREAQNLVLQLQADVRRVSMEGKDLARRVILLDQKSEDLIAVLHAIHEDNDHAGIFGLRNMAAVALRRYDRLPTTTSPEHPAIAS